jgi:hypothetical protein
MNYVTPIVCSSVAGIFMYWNLKNHVENHQMCANSNRHFNLKAIAYYRAALAQHSTDKSREGYLKRLNDELEYEETWNRWNNLGFWGKLTSGGVKDWA